MLAEDARMRLALVLMTQTRDDTQRLQMSGK